MASLAFGCVLCAVAIAAFLAIPTVLERVRVATSAGLPRPDLQPVGYGLGAVGSGVCLAATLIAFGGGLGRRWAFAGMAFGVGLAGFAITRPLWRDTVAYWDTPVRQLAEEVATRAARKDRVLAYRCDFSILAYYSDRRVQNIHRADLPRLHERLRPGTYWLVTLVDSVDRFRRLDPEPVDERGAFALLRVEQGARERAASRPLPPTEHVIRSPSALP